MLGAKMRANNMIECFNIVKDAVDKGELSEAFKGFEKELCEGAVRGLDIDQFENYSEWISWLSWSSIVLDENDYLKAALYALHLAPKLAATDYGTARQRDLGHLWTDIIRGLLGELAFVKWLRERFRLRIELDFRLGRLDEFLPSDIKSVEGRKPKLKISIKTTKLGGIWLDVPYAQTEHSEIFILMRVGARREHFVAFFKKISVIKDKLMKEAIERDLMNKNELEEIWCAVPEFTSMPAYVAGFLNKECFADRLKDRLSIIEADGEVKVKRVIINKYLGFWHPADPQYEKTLKDFLVSKGRNVRKNMRIEFEGIGDFTRTLHFIASSGVLNKSKDDWRELLRKL
jgi:hypothetical protein